MQIKKTSLDSISEERYFELKKVSQSFYKHLKLIVQKSKLAVDLSELEEMVK
ncbi:MAG: hypothetical protein P4L74_01835 [Candidatus Doudnabacteria bacterium]|nr:hypothetical protein [Candidatus Doudnabacteria bacterium]